MPRRPSPPTAPTADDGPGPAATAVPTARVVAGDRTRWLDTVFRSSPVGIGISRLRDGVIVDFNAALLTIIGYTATEVIGRSSADLGIWADPEQRRLAFAQLAAGKAIHELASTIRRQDGVLREVRFSASVVELDGEPHMIGHLRDVTEEVLAGRRRDEAERRLRVALAIVPIAVFRQDTALRYTEIINSQTGRRAGDVVGRNDAELFDAADAAALTAIKARVLASGRGERHELDLHIGDDLRRFDLLVEPDFAPDGSVAAIVCAAADITEHRRRELRYRSVVEDQTELIARHRTDGTLVYVNPVYCRFFGKSEAALVGRSWTPEAHPDDVPRVRAELARLSPQQPVVTIVNRVFGADGEMRWMEFVNRALIDDDGRIREIQSVGRDVTARVALETALADSRRQLHTLYAATEQLRERQRKEIAGEIHDQLGVAFTGIAFALDALRARCGDDPALAGEFDAIRRRIAAAHGTVRDICNRLRPPLLDDLGLVAACRWYLADWSRLTGIGTGSQIRRLAVDPAEPLRTDLFRILQELLTNVARHAGAGRVRVALSAGRNGLRLAVADDGRGFDPRRVDAGFGLAGIRERLTRHGGTLAIDSQAGRTVASVRVPMEAAA